MAISNDSATPPTHVGRDTALLLAPQTVAWQLSFFLFGIYLALLFNTVRDPIFSKFARAVKIVNWLVFALVLIYNILAFVNNLHWMLAIERTPIQILNGWPLDFVFPTSAGLCGLAAQIFLSFRASVLIRSPLTRISFLGVVIALSILSFASSIAVTVLAFILYNHGSSGFSYNNAVSLWLISSAIVDVSISVALTITLRQRVGMVKEVDSLLRRLMIVGLQSACYTAIPAVAGAVVSIVWRDVTSPFSLLHFAFWMPLPCCYGISLYTTIATRKIIDNHIENNFVFHPISNHFLQPDTVPDRDEGVEVESERDGGSTAWWSQSKKKKKTKKTHPLAEIAPWAAHVYRRRMSRTDAAGVEPPPTSPVQFPPGGGATSMRTISEIESAVGSQNAMEDWNHLSEKGIESTLVIKRPAQIHKVNGKYTLSVEQRRKVTEQLRERERDQEEAQIEKDNQRAIWW
ncbi:hypothetical protein JCM5350_004169 [Sporobolomyces pararoseus]